MTRGEARDRVESRFLARRGCFWEWSLDARCVLQLRRCPRLSLSSLFYLTGSLFRPS